MKISRHSDFPIFANWQAVKFLKRQTGGGKPRAPVACDVGSGVRAEPFYV